MTALVLAIVLVVAWPCVSLIAAGGFGAAANARDDVPGTRVDDATGRDEKPAVAEVDRTIVAV
jgi:hypothetical protein